MSCLGASDSDSDGLFLVFLARFSINFRTVGGRLVRLMSVSAGLTACVRLLRYLKRVPLRDVLVGIVGGCWVIRCVVPDETLIDVLRSRVDFDLLNRDMSRLVDNSFSDDKQDEIDRFRCDLGDGRGGSDEESSGSIKETADTVFG